MSYHDNSTTTVGQLKKVYAKNKTAQKVLSSRMDAQITASTDTDADYAAEVADGRVDAWGNAQASLGTNIRSGQNRLTELLTLMQSEEAKNRINDEDLLQKQINELSYAVLTLTATISEIRERERNE